MCIIQDNPKILEEINGKLMTTGATEFIKIENILHSSYCENELNFVHGGVNCSHLVSFNVWEWEIKKLYIMDNSNQKVKTLIDNEK